MEVKFVMADDWQGMYINGKLSAEGHTLSAYEVLDTLAYKFNSNPITKEIDVKVYSVDNNWLEEQGYLPENFEDVKLIGWCKRTTCVNDDF